VIFVVIFRDGASATTGVRRIGNAEHRTYATNSCEYTWSYCAATNATTTAIGSNSTELNYLLYVVTVKFKLSWYTGR